MKAFIRVRIAAGDSAAQIKAKLVDQFGPAVLAEPPKRGFDLLAWLLPLAALGARRSSSSARSRGRGAAGATAASTPPDAELDPDLERRVDEELARYED